MKRPIVLVAIVVVLAGLLVWRVRAQSARSHAPSGGSATVEGIETIIGARIPGRVTEVLVREGDVVKPGQTLVRIDCAENEAALALADARLKAAEAQVDVLEAQVGSAHDSVAVARAQTKAIRAQAKVIAINQDQSQRDRDRAAKLVSAGATPAIELEQTDNRLRGVEEQLNVIDANRKQPSSGPERRRRTCAWRRRTSASCARRSRRARPTSSAPSSPSPSARSQLRAAESSRAAWSSPAWSWRPGRACS